MSTNPNWFSGFQDELNQARAARESGNEGKARVCARRAAGIAIGEYLERQGYSNLDLNTYDRLIFIASLPGLPERTRQIARHLILRVNDEFKLDIEADLIAETYELAEILSGQSQKENE